MYMLPLRNTPPYVLYVCVNVCVCVCVCVCGEVTIVWFTEECLYNTEQQLFKRLRAFCLRPALTRAKLQVCWEPRCPLPTCYLHPLCRSSLTGSNGEHSSYNINKSCIFNRCLVMCEHLYVLVHSLPMTLMATLKTTYINRMPPSRH